MSARNMMGSGTLSRTGTAALLLAASLVLAGCAQTSQGATGGGAAVPEGASKDEYREALSTMDPVTLRAQIPTGTGDPLSRGTEAYAKAVSDWSGGKIKIDIAYSSSVEPKPPELDAALADGRLDLSFIMPFYEPSEFPASAALSDVSAAGAQDPVVGLMQHLAALNSVALESDEIMAEFEDAGVKLLVPAQPSLSVGLACAEPRGSLADLDGVQVRVASTVQSTQAEHLGMSPVSLAFSELYEGLQRGTVDCVLSNFSGATAGGWVPMAKYWLMASDNGFGGSASGFAASQATWDSLPLPAQQLLHDRLDVFLEESVRGQWDSAVAVLNEIDKAGGSVAGFGADAQQDLAGFSADLMNEASSGGAVQGELDEWRATLTEELDYTVVPYADFASWYAKDPDLKPYIDALREDILTPYRPR